VNATIDGKGDRRPDDDGITMLGTTWCGDCVRSRAYLDARSIHYTFIDVDLNADALKRCAALNGGIRKVPTILLPSGEVLVEPSDADLGAAIDRLVSP
jgi:glutaredoxin